MNKIESGEAKRIAFQMGPFEGICPEPGFLPFLSRTEQQKRVNRFLADWQGQLGPTSAKVGIGWGTVDSLLANFLMGKDYSAYPGGAIDLPSFDMAALNNSQRRGLLFLLRRIELKTGKSSWFIDGNESDDGYPKFLLKDRNGDGPLKGDVVSLTLSVSHGFCPLELNKARVMFALNAGLTYKPFLSERFKMACGGFKAAVVLDRYPEISFSQAWQLVHAFFR